MPMSIKPTLKALSIGILGFSVLLAMSHVVFANNQIQVRFSEPLLRALGNNGTQLKDKPSMHYNLQDQVIAFADNDDEAKSLAQKEREVYWVIKGESIRTTIDRWAALNDYSVVYQTNANFEVTKTTAMMGAFLAKDGALAQLLRSLKNTDTPLKVNVMKNKVLVIQANQYTPALLMTNA
ncbi:TcpQ domain-containing protein [Cysteiniphilum marinum]|uniref:TcpQ domain-containing protein n=1 Tax=Cysteiniphilum marinum TaxID=2774191 RepID=UPI00193C13FC|nr:TcpQ domain-containing protein [Cysteiniphilum marinum]